MDDHAQPYSRNRRGAWQCAPTEIPFTIEICWIIYCGFQIRHYQNENNET